MRIDPARVAKKIWGKEGREGLKMRRDGRIKTLKLISQGARILGLLKRVALRIWRICDEFR